MHTNMSAQAGKLTIDLYILKNDSNIVQKCQSDISSVFCRDIVLFFPPRVLYDGILPHQLFLFPSFGVVLRR